MYICIWLLGYDSDDFFITYLDEALKDSAEIKNIIQSGFILIGILAIPAYGLQMFWIKKAETR